ncbi:MAG: CRTAC1 family protein [SAR202 cluster bacterium]|jgi:hypothetical protein|nr:CRTAC1 family protein [SAR202 cluster bacterium]|tara:strand:+ start:2220 stop:4088 length:1869 start_codon:yes stop_codon:yes gene_type:complete
MSATADEARISRVFWRSIATFGIIGTLALAAFLWSGRPTPESIVLEQEVRGPQVRQAEPVAIPALPFTDVTLAAGIDFTHQTGAYGERLLPETMAGGVAFLDYDDDGKQDLVLVNSNHWPWRPTPAERPTSRLYRGRGDGTFEDVSIAAGLDLTLYGMGIAAGDYDGDGRLDIFVTALGENRLFRNVGGERFVDVTADAGVAGDVDAWSTSAAFLDYDRDGDLDLFVCNYVRWSRQINAEVDYRLTGIGRAYGPPTDFGGTDAYLYRNDGRRKDDGNRNGVRYTDVSAQAGIRVAHETGGGPIGKGLAVHPIDVNSDGWLDLAVANDTVRNFLFINQKDGRFVESGIEYGLAFDTGGMATGAMGIDAAYFANDGRLAIAIGNFANEMSSFYVSRAGEQVFSDDAIVAGIGADSRRGLTFGLVFVDIDLDGRLDLVAANGHVEPDINRVQTSQQYAQPIQMFWNCGPRCTRQFRFVSPPAGDLSRPLVGRGAAYADIDGDGDQDLIITQEGGRPVLLRNDQELGHHWVKLRLRAKPPNVHAIGASVTLMGSGIHQYRTVMPSRSYLSQVALPVTIGLGDARTIDEVIVQWPDGERESWNDLDPGREHELQQGTGQVVRASSPQ